MTAALLWLCLFNVIGQQTQAQYFKEDHLTGADYICLAANHTYHLTGREHMGIRILVTSGCFREMLLLARVCRQDGRSPSALRNGGGPQHTCDMHRERKDCPTASRMIRPLAPAR